MRNLIQTVGIIVISCVVFAHADPPVQVCDEGWVPYNDWCYLFHVGRPIQWASARDECNDLDSSLLRFYSKDDLTWIAATAKANYTAMGFWTALNDNPKIAAVKFGTGRWKWGTDEMADMSLIQWSKSPTNDGRSNCAGINVQGKVSDIICSARQGFVCSLNTGSPGCPMGWLPSDSRCYWISNTTDPSQLLSWADAKTWCSKKYPNAGLFTSNNASEVSYILNQLPYYAMTTKLHWIGLQYNTGTGQWGWYDSTPFTPNLITWATEPDNLAGIENCGVLRLTGKFSDRDCTSNSNYICFKPQVSAQLSSNLGCGTWLRAGIQCYGFMRKMRSTWQGARNYCQRYGGDLVKVDSFDKQTWLTEQLTHASNDFVFWTGLNDMATEGQYVWADGSAANQSFVNWNQEPNNFKGTEDCALIYATGQYNDIKCSTHAAAICEIAGATNCPDTTWVQNGQSCYLFTPYNNVSVLYIQQEAAAYCSSFALSATQVGALLSVTSTAEKAFIKKTLQGLADNAYGWWTSLNDQQTEGYWSFADGSSDPSLFDWAGEPSQAPNDDCGLVQYAGAFHERDCSRKLPFICEKYATGFSGAPTTHIAGGVVIVAAMLSALLR